MNGIIIVNKEKNLTSHDVVNRIRHVFNTRQVGHLGTLDPIATGVLVVCLNEATKLVPYLENVTKEYVCEISLGASTDTFDSTGQITNKLDEFCVTEEIIDDALHSFIGTSYQTPPKFSAIKINGKKLYEYARRNEEVEVPTRKITIFEIERISPLQLKNGYNTFKFRILVSKGTYIRSVCNDLGIKLGVPAHMSELTRTKNGEFKLASAWTLDDIEHGNYEIISMLDALKDYVFLTGSQFIQKAINGMKISPIEVKKVVGYLPERIAIKDNNQLVAIYLLDLEKYCYKAGRVWK